MSNSLNYIEFRNASLRNLFVCKELLKSLDSCEERNRKHIEHKTFYLAGYIIEFCYKYALFSHLGLSSSQNVYEFGDEVFKKKWKTHSFDNLKRLCSEKNLKFSQDIPFLGSRISDMKIDSMLKNWDVQFRYSLNITNNRVNLEKDSLTKMLIELENIVNKINSKFF